MGEEDGRSMSDDATTFGLFGVFTITFILLAIMFGVKQGWVVGICVGIAGAISTTVIGYAIWDEIG